MAPRPQSQRSLVLLLLLCCSAGVLTRVTSSSSPKQEEEASVSGGPLDAHSERTIARTYLNHILNPHLKDIEDHEEDLRFRNWLASYCASPTAPIPLYVGKIGSLSLGRQKLPLPAFGKVCAYLGYHPDVATGRVEQRLQQQYKMESEWKIMEQEQRIIRQCEDTAVVVGNRVDLTRRWLSKNVVPLATCVVPLATCVMYFCDREHGAI